MTQFRKILIKSLVKIAVYVEAKSSRIRDEFRNVYWGLRLKKFGEGSRVYGYVHVQGEHHISIGKNCTLNEGVCIFAKERVQIGDYVRISPKVLIITHGLNFDNCDPPYKHYSAPITIEEGVWIASKAVITAGVTIGRHSIVAAGSIVTHSVEPYTIVGGIPAKYLRSVKRQVE